MLKGTYNANDFDQQLRGGFAAGPPQAQEANVPGPDEGWQAFEGEGRRLGGNDAQDNERRYEAWLANIDRAHAAAAGAAPVRPTKQKKKDKKEKKKPTKEADTSTTQPTSKKRNVVRPTSVSTPKPAVISSDLQAMLSSLNS